MDEKTKKTRIFIVIIFIIVIIDILTYFNRLDRHYPDYPLYKEAGQTLLNGHNPYTLRINESNYPPGQFFVYAAIIYFFGPSVAAFKLVVIITNWTNAGLLFWLTKIIVYKDRKFFSIYNNLETNSEGILSLEMKKEIPITIVNRERSYTIPWLTTILFLIFPPERLRVLDGENDSFPIFFMILFFIYFLKKKYILSGMFCALSLLIKLTTFLILPVVLYYLLIQKDWAKFFKFTISTVLTIFGFFLPFLI